MTKNSPNLELFNSIIKEDCENIKEYLSGNCFDFNGFSDFIASNNLSGYLYTAICRLQLSNYFPPDLIKRFKLSYIKQWSKNEKFLREIKALNEIFVKNGCEALFLKGPFLAQRFYGDIGGRFISDIDILAKDRGDFEGLDSLLVKNGYKRQSSYFINKNLTYYFTHHFEYKRQDISLDLHWVLQSHPSFNINYKKIWAQRQKIAVSGNNLSVLPDEYVLVAILLSIFMDIQLGVVSLKSFLDVYMILKAIDKDTDWEEFFENRAMEGLFAISLKMLDLSIILLECQDEFGRLAAYIKQRNAKFGGCRMTFALNLLNNSKYSMNMFKNKLWAFRLYDSFFLKPFLWWAVSFSFRIMTYRNTNPKLLNKLIGRLR